MIAFVQENPGVSVAALGALGTGVVTMAGYIWYSHGLQEGRLFTELKASIDKLDDTLSKLSDAVFFKINTIQTEQTHIYGRIRAIEAVCKERAVHCPMMRGMSHVHVRAEDFDEPEGT